MPEKKVSLSSSKEVKKKPGLAALMPDKTPAAVAARTKAVKQMYAAPKRAAKKTTLISKKTKVTSTVRKTDTKKTSKTTKTTVAVRSKRTAPKIPRSTTVTSVDTEPVVTLPDRVSVRAQEKVLAVLSTITKEWRQSAERVSYVAGFCFVLFGSYVSLSFSGALPDVLLPQAAQVVDTSEVRQKVQPDTARQTAAALKPTFTLHDPLPPVLTEITKHTIGVTNATLSDAAVFSLQSGQKYEVPIEQVVDNTFRLSLDPSGYTPARYVIRVTLESTQDDSMYVFKVGEFEVQRPATDASTNDIATTTAEAGIADEGQSASNDTVSTEAAVEPQELQSLVITTSDAVLKDRTVVQVAAPTDVRSVELYLRPLKSSTMRFLGLAEKSGGLWRYFFDTKHIPNGEYEISARSRVGGSAIESNSLKIVVANVGESSTTPVTEATEELDVEQEDIATDPENSRSFSDVSLVTPFESSDRSDSATATGTVSSFDVDSIIMEYELQLDEILQRYAVARQSENTLMLDLIEDELNRKRMMIVDAVLSDPALNELGNEVDELLKERFEDVKRRIDTFEELRRTATERGSAVDRDSDGISDFDEQSLYRTDPDAADTDGDGVIDGIEIMRGFDPRNAQAESVISYEMPQETFGLVRESLLSVEAVSPVITTSDPTVAPLVQAEIRGKGLPNSFATIYIFSTPTIVTVKTTEDGSFSYILEKELEDGEHEVYVAITDNTGAIVAQSNPFVFIKEAEAFSPVTGTVTAPPVTTMSGVDLFGPFNVAIGLGILAFGIILLMLGATLRERPELITSTLKHDIKAT